jgi:diguanylate cyclase (GGDEF)-like protein
MSQHDGIRSDLRQHVSSIVLRQRDRIADDVPAGGSGTAAADADVEHARRLIVQLVGLLAHAVADGGLAGRGGLVAQLSATAAERAVPMADLFVSAAAVERAALDELAVDETIGALSEEWGAVAQFVRRASFDVLTAVAERSCSAAAAITDPLTAARTRAYFDAALATECDRAGRFGDRLALIVFRVDEAARLDARLGSGVGDRILTRLGILIRQYFRRQDLVARFAADAIAVLLMRSDATHADALADRVRATIERRLESADHRSGEAVIVTVSVAVVHAGGASGAIVDPERLLVDVERALRRAAEHGGNRVEAIQSATAIRTPPRSSPSA